MKRTANKICFLQIHYAKPLPDADHTGLSLQYQREETKYQAGILLMLRGGLSIPPNTASTFILGERGCNKCLQAVTHGDVNCVLPSNTPLHMFGYRTHAHALGSVITGYVYNEKNHKWAGQRHGNEDNFAFFQVSADCGRVSTVAPGFLPNEEDKHCSAWRSCDSQVLNYFQPTSFIFFSFQVYL